MDDVRSNYGLLNCIHSEGFIEMGQFHPEEVAKLKIPSFVLPFCRYPGV